MAYRYEPLQTERVLRAGRFHLQFTFPIGNVSFAEGFENVMRSPGAKESWGVETSSGQCDCHSMWGTGEGADMEKSSVMGRHGKLTGFLISFEGN